MKLVLFSVLLVAIFAGFVYHKYNEVLGPLPLPKFDTNKYWGKGDGKNYKPDKSINKFQVKVDDEVITDLRNQLSRPLKLTPPLEGVQFQYGVNGEALEKWISFWRDDYLPRWKERQAFLNSLPQYTTDVQGLKIHFIHAKPDTKASKGKKVLPVLLLHGWPGSICEFYHIIPLLTKAAETSEYVFEVVAPSLVGYGWSEASAKVGFNANEMAIVMRNLMMKLNYDKFLIQGGDWGSIIGRNLATIFPENVIGYHSNMCIYYSAIAFWKTFIASFNPEKHVPSPMFLEHHFPLKDKLNMFMEETGYLHIQATKPDTIGHALTANPVGMAAYYLEKFQTTGGERNQDIDFLFKAYPIDSVFDNIMVYYLTNCATTAARFYAENLSQAYLSAEIDRVPTPVPSGCIRFKYDLPVFIDWVLRDKTPNLIHSKYEMNGGHFAAMQEPLALYSSFAEFVSSIPQLASEPKSQSKSEL